MTDPLDIQRTLVNSSIVALQQAQLPSFNRRSATEVELGGARVSEVAQSLGEGSVEQRRIRIEHLSSSDLQDNQVCDAVVDRVYNDHAHSVKVAGLEALGRLISEKSTISAEVQDVISRQCRSDAEVVWQAVVEVLEQGVGHSSWCRQELINHFVAQDQEQRGVSQFIERIIKTHLVDISFRQHLAEQLYYPPKPVVQNVRVKLLDLVRDSVFGSKELLEALVRSGMMEAVEVLVDAARQDPILIDWMIREVKDIGATWDDAVIRQMLREFVGELARLTLTPEQLNKLLDAFPGGGSRQVVPLSELEDVEVLADLLPIEEPSQG